MSVRTPAVGSLLILAASVLWGTTGAAAAQAPAVGPLAVGAAAMGVGGLLQAAAAHRAVSAARARLAEHRWTLTTSAVAIAIYPLAFYSSMRLAGVAVGTVVSLGSAPVAAALVERYVDGTPLSARWGVAAALGLAGVAALAVVHDDGAAGDHPVAGVALGLVAGLTYAAYSWGAARLMRDGIESSAAMGAAFGLGGLLLLPVLVVAGGPILASGRDFAVVAYLAIVPMFLGYVLFGRGLAAVPASTATTLTLLEPAVAALIAVAFLHERLSVLGWSGMALLLGSLLVLTLPARRSPAAEPVSSSPTGR